jgi:membrane protein implicated in regulation of membrane protease activity
MKTRVVEDLKRELRRLVLILALAILCTGLALAGVVFGLMAAWTDLKALMGSVGASLVLGIAFLVASLVLLGLLRSVLHRSQHPPSAGKAET